VAVTLARLGDLRVTRVPDAALIGALVGGEGRGPGRVGAVAVDGAALTAPVVRPEATRSDVGAEDPLERGGSALAEDRVTLEGLHHVEVVEVHGGTVVVAEARRIREVAAVIHDARRHVVADSEPSALGAHPAQLGRPRREFGARVGAVTFGFVAAGVAAIARAESVAAAVEARERRQRVDEVSAAVVWRDEREVAVAVVIAIEAAREVVLETEAVAHLVEHHGLVLELHPADLRLGQRPATERLGP